MIDYFKIFLDVCVDKMKKRKPNSNIKKYIKKINKNKSKLNNGNLISVLHDLIDTKNLAKFFVFLYLVKKSKLGTKKKSKKKVKHNGGSNQLLSLISQQRDQLNADEVEINNGFAEKMRDIIRESNKELKKLKIKTNRLSNLREPSSTGTLPIFDFEQLFIIIIGVGLLYLVFNIYYFLTNRSNTNDPIAITNGTSSESDSDPGQIVVNRNVNKQEMNKLYESIKNSINILLEENINLKDITPNMIENLIGNGMLNKIELYQIINEIINNINVRKKIKMTSVGYNVNTDSDFYSNENRPITPEINVPKEINVRKKIKMTSVGYNYFSNFDSNENRPITPEIKKKSVAVNTKNRDTVKKRGKNINRKLRTMSNAGSATFPYVGNPKLPAADPQLTKRKRVAHRAISKRRSLQKKIQNEDN